MVHPTLRVIWRCRHKHNHVSRENALACDRRQPTTRLTPAQRATTLDSPATLP